MIDVKEVKIVETESKMPYTLFLNFPKKDGQYVMIWTYNNKVWSDTFRIDGGAISVYEEDDFIKKHEIINGNQSSICFIKVD